MKAVFIRVEDTIFRDEEKEKKRKEDNPKLTPKVIYSENKENIKELISKVPKKAKSAVVIVLGDNKEMNRIAINKVGSALFAKKRLNAGIVSMEPILDAEVSLNTKTGVISYKPTTESDITLSGSQFVGGDDAIEFYAKLGL